MIPGKSVEKTAVHLITDAASFWHCSSFDRGLAKNCLTVYRLIMKSKRIEDLYLYTDTSCNFGFYIRQGTKGRQQQKQLVNVKWQQEKPEFYLYDMTV